MLALQHKEGWQAAWSQTVSAGRPPSLCKVPRCKNCMPQIKTDTSPPCWCGNSDGAVCYRKRMFSGRTLARRDEQRKGSLFLRGCAALYIAWCQGPHTRRLAWTFVTGQCYVYCKLLHVILQDTSYVWLTRQLHQLWKWKLPVFSTSPLQSLLNKI